MGYGVPRSDDAIYLTTPSAKPYTFIRSIPEADINKGTIDQGYGVAFTLADLPSSSEFTALFDQYRINWVEYTFTLKTPFNALPASPLIYVAEDHDDSSPPSRTFVNERQGCKVLSFGIDRNRITVRVVPTVVNQVYQSAVASGYSRMEPGTWLDCSYPSVPHYGLKYFIDNYNTSVGTIIGTTLRYSVSFKEVI
jgi:hypothetical protein